MTKREVKKAIGDGGWFRVELKNGISLIGPILFHGDLNLVSFYYYKINSSTSARRWMWLSPREIRSIEPVEPPAGKAVRK